MISRKVGTTSNVPFSQTTFIKFSASSLAGGYSLNANAATFTNSGTGPLTLDCTLSGTNPGDFDIDVCPSPVAAGGFTAIKVLCEPVTQGLRTATLNIATNDPDEADVSWPLTCTGLTPDEETIFENGFETQDS